MSDPILKQLDTDMAFIAKAYDGTINLSNIIDITLHMMSLIEKYKLGGETKRNYVLSTISRYVKKVSSGDNILSLFILETLPTLIDRLVALDKGKLRIKAKKWCSCL